MICPECNGRGEAIYFVETDRDENTVTVEKRKGICRTCNGSGEKPQTNADRIRAMSDEELAKFIPDWSYTNACKCDEQSYVDCNNECEKCVLEWLKQPVEVDHE